MCYRLWHRFALQQRAGLGVHHDGDVGVQLQHGRGNLRRDGAEERVAHNLRLIDAAGHHQDGTRLMMVPMPMV